MKRIINVISIIILLITITAGLNVKASNYEMRELIPTGTKTTIRSKNLLYKNFYYENGFVNFATIKNNSKEKQKISISIGLFDENKKNIGTIFYCSDETLSPKEERDNYMIDVKGSYIEEGKNYSDIKYIAVLDDNSSCKKEGSYEYLGQTVEEIGMPKNTQLSDNAKLLLNMLEVIGIVLVILFLFKFLFTNAYKNMDGTDVRQEYAYINKQLRKERERKARWHRPEPKEVKTEKTKEIIKKVLQRGK